MTKNDYALRRVLYYMMIVAKGVQVLVQKKGDHAMQEACRAGVLISLRALSMFLTDNPDKQKDGSRKYPEDTFITEFGLKHREGLVPDVRKRINKLVAHPVNKRYRVFKDPQEIWQFAEPVLNECAEFVTECLGKQKARLTGKARKYLQTTKELMPELPLPQVT